MNINFFLRFILILNLISANLKAQNFEWVKSFGGNNVDTGMSIFTDTSGNVYTTGTFYSTVDFDHGNNVYNLTSNGNQDIFIQKLDANGNFVWAKSIGGSTYDYSGSIILDNLGNIYITGSFSGTVDFDPGLNTFYLSSNGNDDIFILKLDNYGNLIWAKSIGGVNSDGSTRIKTDLTGNIYISGVYRDTVDFDPGIGIFNLSSPNNQSIFILKLNHNGNFIWAKSIGGNNAYISNWDLSLDNLGNIYNSGSFSGTINFNPNSNSNTISSTGIEMYIHKVDQNGNFVWVKNFGTNGLSSVITDSFGNIYITGGFVGTVDFNPSSSIYNLVSNGNYDIFIQKLDSNGNFIWAKSIGGISIDTAFSIYLDTSGNPYITGYFSDTVDFDPGIGTVNLNSTSGGSQDIFILKLDTSGNFVWVKTMGGTLLDNGLDIFLDNSNSIYTTGYFYGTANFNSNGIINLTSNGESDIFIHKMSQPLLDVNDFQNNFELKVYPNPTKELIHIEFNEMINEVEFIITDINGKVILTESNHSIKNKTIKFPSPNGVYFLNINSGKEKQIIKLIKD